MKKVLSKYLLIMVMSFMQFNVLAQADQIIHDDRMIAPDQHMQDQINRIVASGTREEISREILKLKQMGGTAEYILQQLLYFRANASKVYFEKKITSVQMDRITNVSYFIIIGVLDLDVNAKELASASAQIMVNTVVPYLKTKDPELRKQLHWLLKKVDFRGDITPYYSEYETYIKRSIDNLPQELIQYMYEKSPEDALLVLMRVNIKESEARDPIIQAEKVISNDFQKRYFGPVENRKKVGVETSKTLDALSKNEQWWVRLYVAEVIGREPVLRSPEILERLKKDANPLVHETLKRFQIE